MLPSLNHLLLNEKNLLNVNEDAIAPVELLKNILEKLNETFGYGNFQPVIQKQQILSQIEFPVSMDHIQVFLSIDKQLNILKIVQRESGSQTNTRYRISVYY